MFSQIYEFHSDVSMDVAEVACQVGDDNLGGLQRTFEWYAV